MATKTRGSLSYGDKSGAHQSRKEFRTPVEKSLGPGRSELERSSSVTLVGSSEKRKSIYQASEDSDESDENSTDQDLDDPDYMVQTSSNRKRVRLSAIKNRGLVIGRYEPFPRLLVRAFIIRNRTVAVKSVYCYIPRTEQNINFEEIGVKLPIGRIGPDKVIFNNAVARYHTEDGNIQDLPVSEKRNLLRRFLKVELSAVNDSSLVSIDQDHKSVSKVSRKQQVGGSMDVGDEEEDDVIVALSRKLNAIQEACKDTINEVSRRIQANANDREDFEQEKAEWTVYHESQMNALKEKEAKLNKNEDSFKTILQQEVRQLDTGKIPFEKVYKVFRPDHNYKGMFYGMARDHHVAGKLFEERKILQEVPEFPIIGTYTEDVIPKLNTKYSCYREDDGTLRLVKLNQGSLVMYGGRLFVERLILKEKKEQTPPL